MQVRYLKVIVPVLLVLAMAACAKPPQADIDAARGRRGQCGEECRRRCLRT